MSKPSSDKSESAAKLYDVDMQWNIKIPMRDGVKLSATLYLPKTDLGPRPTIFSLTPYIAESDHNDAYKIAKYGYPYLAVDVRGRGDSEGEFRPFFNNPKDGHDIVEWIAKQSYCDGKVGMRGVSYVGFTQWATMRERPPHLATIIPSAPCYLGLDYPLRFNVFFAFLAPWLIFTMGKPAAGSILADSKFWSAEFLRFAKSGRPYKDLTRFFGFDLAYFNEWMKHPHQDEYWDQGNPQAEQLRDLETPILSLTGMYDGDQPGTLEFHRLHLEAAGDRANHYLVIGPWDHPGVAHPVSPISGVIKCGPDAVIDMPKLHSDWYAWTMAGGEKPEFLKDKVAHYVMEADKWRYAATLDEVTHHYDDLYLQSTANPNDALHSGQLAPTLGGRIEPDEYIYDPSDLSRLEDDNARVQEGVALAASMIKAPAPVRNDVLYYHTAPFEEDTEVTGTFKLSAWISLDQPDTDFSVNIFEVDETGAALYLTQQVMRARYREGLRTEKLIETTEPLLYVFDRFFFVSRQIKKGRRLRLMIEANHTLHWQKNFNSGKPNADETLADARVVKVKLHHDKAHPSALHVPIGRPDTDGEA